MDARLHEIYSRYNTELKPLIAEQEARMSAFEEPLLLNLSKMFDNLSQALIREGDVEIYLKEMNNMLTTCISQSYMYIAAAIKDDVKRFEKNNGGTIRIKLEKGVFASAYENLKDEIREIDKLCKINKDDYISHLDDYKASFLKCQELEKMIEEVNDTETLLHSSKGSWLWTVFGWCVSIIISVLVGKHSLELGSKIWEAAKTMLGMQ